MMREICAIIALLLAISPQMDCELHLEIATDTMFTVDRTCTGSTTLHWWDGSEHLSRTFSSQQDGRVVNRIRLGRGGRQAHATSSGNCCWKFHNRPGLRGRGFVLDRQVLGQRTELPFEVRSLRTIDCLLSKLSEREIRMNIREIVAYINKKNKNS